MRKSAVKGINCLWLQFPHHKLSVTTSPAYGVFISQLIRYARACSSYECFILRVSLLSSKLLKLGYLVEHSKSSFGKLNGRYGFLIQQYVVSLSRMLKDILTLDQLQWLFNRSDFSPVSWPGYQAWPSLNYEWFPWSICNGWHASRERLPFRIPGSVPLFGTCLCSNYQDWFVRTCLVFSRIFTLRCCQTSITWLRSLSAILPLFWRHDIANISTFAAKTWEKLLWRHEIHDVFPRNWANALQNL